MVDIDNFLNEFNSTFEEKNKNQIINRYRIWLNISDVCDLGCIYCSSFCDIQSAKQTKFITLENAIERLNTPFNELNKNKHKN